MDFAKILGAVLSDRMPHSPTLRRTVELPSQFPPAQPQRPAHAGGGSGPLGSVLAEVVQEAIRRNAQEGGAWQGRPTPGGSGGPAIGRAATPRPQPTPPGNAHGHGHGHGHAPPPLERPGFPGAFPPPAPGHAPDVAYREPCHDFQDRSVLLLRAMIMAARSDGAIDAAEEQAIVSRLGRLTQEEVQFLRQEFARPLDLHGFAHSVPPGLEAEVYAMSLMAIRLDNQYEGQYLYQLAERLRLQPQIVDQIHQQLGAPCLRW